MTPEEIANALNEADRQLVAFGAGGLGFDEWVRTYADFYDRYALDGHEGDEQVQAALRSLDERLRPHLLVRDEVLHRVTSDELLSAEARQAGFIGPAEARERVANIVRRFGLSRH